MKKKLIIFITTIILILCCSFAFESCVKEPTKKHSHKWSTELTSDETHHWRTCSGCSEINDKAEHIWNVDEIIDDSIYENDSNITLTCKIQGCGKTKNLSAILKESFVSQEEWTNAFDERNFVNNCKIDYGSYDSPFCAIIVNGNIQFVHNNKIIHIYVFDKINNTERYYWQADSQSDKWYYIDTKIEECDVIKKFSLLFDLTVIGGHFNDFTYDLATESYVYEGDGILVKYSEDKSYTIKEITIKFLNGKIFSLSKLLGDDFSTTEYYTFTYGGQVINLPPVENCICGDTIK